MSENKSKNPFHILKTKSPRAWAVVVFPFFLLITVIFVPLVYLYEVIVDVPRIVGNLWDDFTFTLSANNRKMCEVVGFGWNNLYTAFMLNKDVNNEKEEK